MVGVIKYKKKISSLLNAWSYLLLLCGGLGTCDTKMSLKAGHHTVGMDTVSGTEVIF